MKKRTWIWIFIGHCRKNDSKQFRAPHSPGKNDRLDLLETLFGGGLISRNEGLDALEKLARIMRLSVGVYEDVHKVIEGLE